MRKVVRSIPHPHYQVSPTHQNHEHDIMLLGLQSPVRLGGRIRVLPLSHEDRLPPGTCCRVSGWGTTTSPQGRHLLGPPRSQGGQENGDGAGREDQGKILLEIKMEIKCICSYV